jgi:amidophosphoribosyltransferase
VVASETCAFDLIGASFERDVSPGEMIVFKRGGADSKTPFRPAGKRGYCIFEHIYFSRPDSRTFGRSVYEMRKGFGRRLAAEQPACADVVVPVPDSGVPAAIGFAEASGIPFQVGLIRNHYVGRTFIEPAAEIRHFGVKVKLSPVKDVLAGRKVVVIDDSIVRGTTSRKIVDMVRRSGAEEVHLRISSPPTRFPCYFGIDTPTKEDLIASKKSVDATRDFIGADSLGYLSIDGLYGFAKDASGEWYCDGCFTGDYP